MKKKANRVYLTRVQHLEICTQAKEGAYTPDIANKYKVSVPFVISILKDLDCGQYQRFKDWSISNKPNLWTKERKAELEAWWLGGFDDEEIAKRMNSSYPTIARTRSRFGFVKFNQTRTKGHHSGKTHNYTIKQGELPFEQLKVIDGSKLPIIINDPIKKPEIQEIIIRDCSIEIPKSVVMKLDELTWKDLLMAVVGKTVTRLFKVVIPNQEFIFKLDQCDPEKSIAVFKLISRKTFKIQLANKNDCTFISTNM